MQRIFIGVPVDRRVQRRINELLDPLKDTNRNIRWVPEHNRHLTLAFVGDQPADLVDALSRSMDKAFRQDVAFQTVLSSLERFPDARGNILALVCTAGDPLTGLFEHACGLLAQYGLAPEYSNFRPHITVGRVSGPGLLDTMPRQAADITLHVDRVVLYQSTLTRTGSIYQTLEVTEFGQAGAGP